MKFKALLLGCLLFSGVASAQVDRTYNEGSGDFKPTAGAKSFEVNFSPFSGSPIGINYLRGRLFVSDNTAYRAGVNLSIYSSDPNSSFELGVAPGIEQHFAGTSRLSPYIGAELALGLRSASANYEAGGSNVKVSGAFADVDHYSRGFFKFGLNGVIGCDFYFAKNIFMGFEAGYGINYINHSQIQRTRGGETQVIDESRSEFSIAPNVKSAIRLGFVF